MTVKHLLLIVLVLVNLVLLTALGLNLTAPRSAEAQVVGGGFNYAVVTATYQGAEQVLWVLDLRNRKLSVLMLPEGNKKNMQLLDTVDVARHLRGAGADDKKP